MAGILAWLRDHPDDEWREVEGFGVDGGRLTVAGDRFAAAPVDLLRLFERMLADRFFKPSNMELFRVAKTVPEVFGQIEAAAGAKAESKWFETR